MRCAAPRRVVLWRVVLCGAWSCCVALWCAAVLCAVLPRVVPWWVGGGQAGPCRGAQCRSERGWLVALGCGQVGGSLGPCCGGLDVLLGPLGPVGVRGVALSGGLCRGPVFSGVQSLALDAVALPLSLSGACEVAPVMAGVVAWR